MSHPLYNPQGLPYSGTQRSMGPGYGLSGQAGMDPMGASRLGPGPGSSALQQGGMMSSMVSQQMGYGLGQRGSGLNPDMESTIDMHIRGAREEARMLGQQKQQHHEQHHQQAITDPRDPRRDPREGLLSSGGGMAIYPSSGGGGRSGRLDDQSGPIDWSAYQNPGKLFSSSPSTSSQPRTSPSPAQMFQTSGFGGAVRGGVSGEGGPMGMGGPSSATSSSDRRQPRYTSESATSILASFGLSNEDLELLSHYPDDQLTPDNLPFILRDIRIRKSKRSSSLDVDHRPQAAGRGVGAGGGSDHLAGGGPADSMKSKVIDYGHASKYGGYPEDAGGVDGGGSGGPGDSYGRSGRDSLPEDAAVKYGAQHQHMGGVGGSPYSGMMTNQDLGKRSQQQQHQKQQQQQQRQQQSPISLPKKDMDDRLLDPKAPKPIPVRDPGTNRLPATTNRAVAPGQAQARSDLVVLSGGSTVGPGVGAGKGSGVGAPVGGVSAGVLNPAPVPAWPPAFPLMDMSVPLPPMLHVPVTIPSPPVGHHPHPHHPMGPAAAVTAMMQMPPGHPMSRPPPPVVPSATLLPTPSMMSDYSATTPRIFPHTCSLCNVECYQIKNWIEHQNSSHHIESCRHLRQQFPNWNVETLSVPSRNEASPYQELFQRRQDSHSASRSQSWSRSPSPRRGYHSSGPSSYRRAHSRSRSKSPRRHVRRSRSKSRSPRRQMRASPSSSSSHRRRSPQGRRSRSRSRSRERDREWRTALQRSGRSAANPGKKHRSSSAEKLAKKLLKTSSGLSLTKGTSLEAMMQSLAPALLAELAKKRGTTNAPATSSCKGNGRKLSSSQKTASSSSKSTATKAATGSATKAATGSATKAATGSATKAATGSATKAATGSATKAASATTKAATGSATKAATGSATKAASATTKAASATTKAATATKAAMSSKVKVSKTSSPPPPSSSPSTSSSSCQVKKTSAPGRDCLLWLKGVPAHTTHEDVVKAVQPFGHTNMVILLKAIHEASVLMENEEDAQALANCKDFTIRGMPVTIVMEKDTQLQDGKTEQKEQMPADRKATTTKTQSSTTKSTSSKTSLRTATKTPLTATKTSLTATKPQTVTTKTTPKGSTSTPKAQTATAKAQTTTPSNTPTDAAAAPKAAPTDAKPEVPIPVKDRTWKFVSMTGLPESGYKEEDVLRLARPFNYRHGSQNSFILPLQRRALFRMRGVQNAVAMVKAYTDNPPTLLDCKLSVEQVTLPLSLSKCQTFQMLMDLSNMRCDEPEMLRERLLIVTNIPPGLDGMERVLQVVRGRGLFRRFIPLINKIYFEMEDGEVAARVYNHYQNFPCHIHNWTMRFSIFNAKPKPVKNSPPLLATAVTPAKSVATVTAAGSTSAPRRAAAAAAATPRDQRPGSDGIIVIDSDSDEPMEEEEEEEVDEEDEEDEEEPCQEEHGATSPVKDAGDEAERGSRGVKAAKGDDATGAMKMERGEGRREKKEGEATAAAAEEEEEENNNNNNGDSIVTAVTVTAPEVAVATSSSAPTAEVGTEVKQGLWIADKTAATAAVPGRAAESLVTADDQSQDAANSSETQPPAPGNGTSAPCPSGPADFAPSVEPDGLALPVGVTLAVNPEEKPLDFPPVTREILKALEAAVHQHRMERRAEEQTKQNQAKPDQDQNQDQDQGEAAPPTQGRGAQPDKKSPPAGEKKPPAAVKNQAQPEKKSHTPAAEKRTPSQAEKNNPLDKKSPAKQDKKTHPERGQTSGKKTPAKKPSPQGADSSKKAQSDQKTQGSAGRGRRGDHSSPERKDLSRLRSSRAPSEEEQPPTSRRGNSSSSSSGSRRGKQDDSPVAKRRRREEEQRKSHSSSRPSRSESHKIHAPEKKGSSYTTNEITSDPVPDLDEFDLDEFNLDEFVTVDEVGEEAESTSLPQDSSSSSSSSTSKKTEPQRSSKRRRSQETPAPKGSQEPSTKTSSHKPTTTLSFTPVSDPPAQKKPAPSQKPQKKNAPSAKAAVAAKKTQPAKPAAASGRKTRSSAASSSATAREVMENNDNAVEEEEPKNPQPIGEATGNQQQEEEVPETVEAEDDVEGAVARAGQQVSPGDTAVAGETEESAVSEAAVMEAADTLATPPEAEEEKDQDQADLASSVLEKGAQNGACPPPVEASLTDASVLEEEHQEPLKASGEPGVGYQAPGGESFQIPDSVDGRVATEDGGKTPKEACLGRQVPESQDEPMSQEEKPTYQVVGSVDDQQPTQEEGSQVQKEDGVADQVREKKSHRILHSVDNLITTEEEEKGNQVPEKEGGKNPGESYKILDSVDVQTTTEEDGNRTSVKQAPNDGESDFQILDSLDAQTTTEEEQGNQMHKEEEFQVLDSLDDQPAKEGEPDHQMTQTPTAETEGSVDPPQSPKKGALVTLDEVSEEEEDYPDDATEEEELMKKQALEKEKAREREKERERRRSKEREISRERSKEKERGRKREEKWPWGKERVGADTEGLVTLDEVGGDEPVEGDEGLEEADLQALVTLDEIVDEEGGEDESGDAFNPELLVTLDEAVGDDEEEEEMKEEQSKLSAAAPDPQQTYSTGEPAGSPGPEEEGKDLEEIRKMNFVTVDEVGEEEEEEEQVVTTRRGARAKKRAGQTPVRKSNRGKRGGAKVNEQEEEEEEEEEQEEEPPADTAPPFKEPALNPPSSLVKDSESPESGSQPPASSPELKEKEADVAAERPSAEALSSGQEPRQDPPETQSLEQERTVSCDDKADRRAALKDDSKNRREEADPEAKRCRSQSPMITGFKLPPFSPDNPIGVDFVVPKTGFFCKLCSLFYGSEDSAKKNHCSSLRHYQNMEKYYQKLQKQPAGCLNQPSSQGSTHE